MMSLRHSAFGVCLHVIVASGLTAIGSKPQPKLHTPSRGNKGHGLLKHIKTHAAHTVKEGQKRASHTTKQAQRHNHETHVHAQRHKVTLADPEPPRMFVAEGCDGSTALMQHAIIILGLHGIDGGDPAAQKELLDAKRNPYYVEGQTGVIEAMNRLQKDHRNNKQTFVFKSILHRDLGLTVNPAMINMGTLAVYVTRKNMLDQLVCMVRDCFLDTNKDSTRFGYPVDKNGNPSDLCFQRRDTNDHNYKALLKVVEPVPSGKHNRSYLDENLLFLEEQASSGYELLKKAGYNAPHIAYEDLVAFEEGGASNLQISLKAWSTLLEGWGVQADDAKVRRYLLSQGSTWKLPRQSSYIFNYKQVLKELKNLGRDDQIRV